VTPHVDVHRKLDELTAMVEGARSMPMSASCVLHRGELLALIDELREAMPGALREAEYVLADRAEVIEEGRREALRLLDEGRAEQERLVSETEVVRAARIEADRLLDEAHKQSEAMRIEVEDYVDAKLANFEVVLHKTLAAVHRGREKLGGRHELDSLRDPEYDTSPLPG